MMSQRLLARAEQAGRDSVAIRDPRRAGDVAVAGGRRCGGRSAPSLGSPTMRPRRSPSLSWTCPQVIRVAAADLAGPSPLLASPISVRRSESWWTGIGSCRGQGQREGTRCRAPAQHVGPRAARGGAHARTTWVGPSRYDSEPSYELRREARLLRVFTETELFDAARSVIDRRSPIGLPSWTSRPGFDLRTYEELREVLAAVGGPACGSD